MSRHSSFRCSRPVIDLSAAARISRAQASRAVAVGSSSVTDNLAGSTRHRKRAQSPFLLAVAAIRRPG
jgi:hypothetical protein